MASATQYITHQHHTRSQAFLSIPKFTAHLVPDPIVPLGNELVVLYLRAHHALRYDIPLHLYPVQLAIAHVIYHLHTTSVPLVYSSSVDALAGGVVLFHTTVWEVVLHLDQFLVTRAP